jgi:hypothetical protein
MNRDAADRAITDLGTAYDRVATTMYLIDSHPGLVFLKSGHLTGRTAEVWAALSAEVDARWSEFSALGSGLEQARDARARYRPSDAEWQPMQTALTSTLPRLAASLDTSCNTVTAILGDVNAAWTAASAASTPIVDALAALRQRAEALGDTSEIEPLGRRTALACDRTLSDPIGSAPQGVLLPTIRTELAALSADIAAAATRIADQERARDAFPEQLAALMTQIDAVADAETEVRAAYAARTRRSSAPACRTSRGPRKPCGYARPRWSRAGRSGTGAGSPTTSR